MRWLAVSALDVGDPDAERGAAVLLADDQLLGDVDETAGQVARVGGTQRRVDQALAGAGRGDEVLERLETLAEVRLDRARDHVATRVGDEAAHAGDLAHLGHVAAGTRADHHVDRVEALRLELDLHRVLDVLGGVGPDAHLLLAALTVGDDAAPELVLDLLGLLLVAVEQRALGLRRAHVVDRHREPRLRRVPVAQVLDPVEGGGDLGGRVVVGQALDDHAHLALLDRGERRGRSARRSRPATPPRTAPDRPWSCARSARGGRRLIVACSSSAPSS